MYGLAVAATLAALLCRLAIGDVVEDPALVIFMVPIILSAYLGGLGPGLTSTAVAMVVSAYFLLPPLHNLGVERPFDWVRLAILMLAGGMVSGMSGRLRRDRRRVQASEERLQTVVESLSEGLVVSDLEGELLHWNRAGLAMHGFASLEEGRRHLGKFRDIFELSTLEGSVLPYEDWPLRRVLRREPLRDLDLVIRRLDVPWERIFSYGGTLVSEPSGRELAILTITDVTDRRRAEQALLASEARFRQLAESVHEVFWLVDPQENQLLYVSPAYETIWGRSCQSLYASPRDWMMAVHPEDQERIHEAARTKQAAGLYDEEYRIVRPDGAVRWIRDKAFPVRDESGRITRIAGTAEDITEHRQLEAQLRQTQKLESIGQLAGGVAHDFNNWLTVISGCTELVAEMLPAEPAAGELVAEIKHAGERAAALTRQLLAFSRREVLAPAVIDLNTVVADTEKLLRRILGEDIVLTTVLTPTISRVRVDAGQWIQILMNLAVNARDAMPTGGKLTIETREVHLDEAYTKLHPSVRAGHYVVLAVSDTGAGMTSDVKARIFDPFFTTKPLGEGTGLGLAVVHGIVEQSGGHIGVYSEPGIGTTFNLYLPTVEADADSSMKESSAPARPHGTETILLVEDEDSVRRITARILRRHGYTVLEASGGAAALDLLKHEHRNVTLLITDVVMPHMDGRELAETVQACYPEIKVIYTSGYTEDAVVRHGILHAEVAFLQKPHTSAMLIGKIREVLDPR
jgi:two-component system cell cycle sensor histidine kinase/response regulator CckA